MLDKSRLAEPTPAYVRG